MSHRFHRLEPTSISPYNYQLSINYTLCQLLKVPTGDDLRLTCSATGFPLPEVFWVREDSNQTRFYDSPKVAIENTPGMSVLTIMSVNQRFTGAYSCHAKNKVGEQQMMTMLNVDIPPTILSAQKGSFQK